MNLYCLIWHKCIESANFTGNLIITQQPKHLSLLYIHWPMYQSGSISHYPLLHHSANLKMVAMSICLHCSCEHVSMLILVFSLKHDISEYTYNSLFSAKGKFRYWLYRHFFIQTLYSMILKQQKENRKKFKDASITVKTFVFPPTEVYFQCPTHAHAFCKHFLRTITTKVYGFGK